MNCVYCESENVVKRGKRYNQSGTKQLFLCRDCDGSFIEHDGFERMRHRKEDIVRAIHQHEDGMSLKNVKNHLWQHDGVKISREGIRLWEKKYSVFLKSNEFESATSPKRKAAFRRKVRQSKRKRRL